MSDISDRFKIQACLKLWEEGHISLGELDSKLGNPYLKAFFGALESGEEVMAFGSCCCSSHPPDRTFTIQITLQPHGYTAKRLTGKGE